MKCPVIIQTCDKYERFWGGMFKFMSKHWDQSIDSEIFFCNEELPVSLPQGFKHLPTGKGTFVENLKVILDKVGEEQVFYMLEDFWPTAPMSNTMFSGLHKFFVESDADAVQVSSYLPYYSLDTTEQRNMFKFRNDSEWIFNFQARFWKTNQFHRFLVEPEISESSVGSAITVEIAADKKARQCGGILAFLYHYMWYPISGVSYRGDLTEIGMQMQNIANIDEFVEQIFNEQGACTNTLPLSNL
jgi:hypothetical protein